MLGLRDPLSVDLEDDVVLPDAGAVGGAAGAHRLHEHRVVAGQGQAVAQVVAPDKEVSGTGEGRIKAMN